MLFDLLLEKLPTYLVRGVRGKKITNQPLTRTAASSHSSGNILKGCVEPKSANGVGAVAATGIVGLTGPAEIMRIGVVTLTNSPTFLGCGNPLSVGAWQATDHSEVSSIDFHGAIWNWTLVVL